MAGLTLNESARLKTQVSGSARMIIGEIGQIELKAETDFTVHQVANDLKNSLGGELRAGQVMVTARPNVSVAIQTANHQITTDGKTAALLSVAVEENGLTIRAFQGDAKIVLLNKPTEAKSETVAAGEEVSLNLQAQNWQHRRVTADDMLPAQPPPPPSFSLLHLLSASIYYSFHRLIDSFHASPFLFDSTLTCRDKDSLRCHQLGGVTP